MPWNEKVERYSGLLKLQDLLLLGNSNDGKRAAPKDIFDAENSRASPRKGEQYANTVILWRIDGIRKVNYLCLLQNGQYNLSFCKQII